jgi:hypothetical protein
MGEPAHGEATRPSTGGWHKGRERLPAMALSERKDDADFLSGS